MAVVVVVVEESSFILMGMHIAEREALTTDVLLPGGRKIENAGVSRSAASAAFLPVFGASPIAGTHFWNFTSFGRRACRRLG